MGQPASVSEAAPPARSGEVRGFAGRGAPTRKELLAAAVRWPRPSAFARPLTTLHGVGPRLAEAAAEAGIATIGDLLLRVPHSYRDRSEVRALGELKLGEPATVMVEVRKCTLRRPRRRGLTIVEATVADGTGSAKATWFNQPWLADKLVPGTGLLLHGALDRRGFRVSDYEIVAGSGEATGIHTTGLVPVHPATERLKASRIREWVWRALPYGDDAIEPLPAELRCRRALCGAADALRAVHFPATAEEAQE